MSPPLKLYTVKVDSAGRIKLPTDFQEYFTALGHSKFFITSLDRKLGIVYPISLWNATARFLEEQREDPELADAVAFNAAELGGEAEPDANGRMLLPAELRRELKIESEVRLKAAGQKIEILSDEIFQAAQDKGRSVGSEGVAKLRKMGLPK